MESIMKSRKLSENVPIFLHIGNHPQHEFEEQNKKKNGWGIVYFNASQLKSASWIVIWSLLNGLPKIDGSPGFGHSLEWDVIETHIDLSAFLVSMIESSYGARKRDSKRNQTDIISVIYFNRCFFSISLPFAILLHPKLRGWNYVGASNHRFVSKKDCFEAVRMIPYSTKICPWSIHHFIMNMYLRVSETQSPPQVETRPFWSWNQSSNQAFKAFEIMTAHKYTP